MKGEFVVVRGYGDTCSLCRVWEESGDIIAVSAPEEFERLAKGQDALMPVGVPRRDVFRYDAGVDKRLRIGSINWSLLTPF